ncbi:hypothetical protein TNCV_4114021 [Trichonephila clavipes]|nr:hypothetical protein TNCV_4114021 [Trichonephila clavipes]
MACHAIRHPFNKARLRRAWKATHDFIAQWQRLWHDLPQEVIGDFIDSMPHRVLAFIADRRGFTTCHSFLIKQPVLPNL